MRTSRLHISVRISIEVHKPLRKCLLQVYYFLLFFLFFILSLPLYAQNPQPQILKKRLAVLDFSANNTPASIARIVRNNVEIAFFEKGRFEVLERSKIDLILKTKKQQDALCKTKECAAQVGSILNAEYVVIGSVDKLDNYTVTLKVVDVKKNMVIAVDSREVPRLGLLKTETLKSARYAAEIALGERKPRTDHDLPVYIHFGLAYVYPLGELHKIAQHGIGGICGGSLSDLFLKNSLLGADLNYFYVQGNNDETKFLHSFSLVAHAGYAFFILPRLKLAPSLGLGFGYNFARYFPYANIDTTRTKSALQPLARCSASLSYAINNTFSIEFRPSISTFFEPNGLAPFMTIFLAGSIKL